MRNTFPAGFDLNDQTVVVTGAAAGIGMAIAELFAAQRANLVMLDIAPGVVDAAGKLGARHLGLACDVSDLAQVRAAVAAVDARFGRIDVLVNNAGVALLNKAEDVSEAEWEKTMAVNLKAPFFPGAGGRQGYGRIINLASQASVIALDRHAAYCASKAALVSLTGVLATEWAARWITVNAVRRPWSRRRSASRRGRARSAKR